jgi:pimeloyl-ACP methyl ester carboxylesterase
MKMIEDVRGCIDYDVSGAGPTIVLVPGSCSTAAAWRPVIATWDNQFRCVTTSLLGYGGTAERRPAGDASIAYGADALETVVGKAGGPVHLVGHSFGGLVALAVALRNRVPLASLTIVEPPAVELLRESGEQQLYRAFGRMSEAYFAAFEGGNAEAIAAMIDFYGGAGTFASWPPRVRAYAVATTAVNILDWASAYGFALSADLLSAVEIPVLVVRGGASHPAMQRICALLSEGLCRSALATIDGAAHFMIATHVDAVSRLIARHAREAEAISAEQTNKGGALAPNMDALPDGIRFARQSGSFTSTGRPDADRREC